MGELILMTLNGYKKLERQLEQLRNGKSTELTHLIRDSLVDEDRTTALPTNDYQPLIEDQIQEIECLLACAVVVSSE